MARRGRVPGVSRSNREGGSDRDPAVCVSERTSPALCMLPCPLKSCCRGARAPSWLMPCGCSRERASERDVGSGRVGLGVEIGGRAWARESSRVSACTKGDTTRIQQTHRASHRHVYVCPTVLLRHESPTHPTNPLTHPPFHHPFHTGRASWATCTCRGTSARASRAASASCATTRRRTRSAPWRSSTAR